MSIVFVTMGVPIWLSTAKRPRGALRRAQTLSIIYALIWAYMCLRLYPQLVQIE
jgi:hypothetical protein